VDVSPALEELFRELLERLKSGDFDSHRTLLKRSSIGKAPKCVSGK
jgi:hypothetical protein